MSDAMPDTTAEWVWWVFSVLIVGVVINLISPRIGRFLEARLDRYRAWRASNNRQKDEFVAKTLALIEQNELLIHTVIYESIDYQNRITNARTMQLLAATLTAISALLGRPNLSLLFLVILLPFIAIEERLKDRYVLYDRVIGEYGNKGGMPRPPR